MYKTRHTLWIKTNFPVVTNGCDLPVNDDRYNET